MSNLIHKINWTQFFDGLSVDQMYTKFLKFYEVLCERFIPRLKCAKKNQPWMNRDLKILVRKKYSAWKTFSASGWAIDKRMRYIDISRECRKAIRKALIKYETELAKKSKSSQN